MFQVGWQLAQALGQATVPRPSGVSQVSSLVYSLCGVFVLRRVGTGLAPAVPAGGRAVRYRSFRLAHWGQATQVCLPPPPLPHVQHAHSGGARAPVGRSTPKGCARASKLHLNSCMLINVWAPLFGSGRARTRAALRERGKTKTTPNITPNIEI